MNSNNTTTLQNAKTQTKNKQLNSNQQAKQNIAKRYKSHRATHKHLHQNNTKTKHTNLQMITKHLNMNKQLRVQQWYHCSPRPGVLMRTLGVSSTSPRPQQPAAWVLLLLCCYVVIIVVVVCCYAFLFRFLCLQSLT